MRDTRVTMLRRMMPTDANPSGNVFGGAILRYIDEVAGAVAERHARSNVVTAAIHRMDFLEPAFIGHLLHFDAVLAYTGRSSMDVRVEVSAENMRTGELLKTGVCWLTLVALNERGRPFPVPPVKPETPDEHALYEEAKRRRESEKKV